MNEEQSKKYLSGGGKVKDLPEGLDGAGLGACEWVELRKMEDSEDGVPTYCSNDMKPSPKRTRDCTFLFLNVSKKSVISVSISEVAPVDPSTVPVKGETIPVTVLDYYLSTFLLSSF